MTNEIYTYQKISTLATLMKKYDADSVVISEAINEEIKVYIFKGEDQREGEYDAGIALEYRDVLYIKGDFQL